MKTSDLELLPCEPGYLLALFEGADVPERYSELPPLAPGLRELFTSGEVSKDFMEKLRGARSADPCRFGFFVMHTGDKLLIGSYGFTGPPGKDGVVEIAYGSGPVSANSRARPPDASYSRCGLISRFSAPFVSPRIRIASFSTSFG